MKKEETKVVVFPETVKEWNALLPEEKIRLLFHDTWLGDLHRENLWYHYTTIDALTTMISTNGIEIWATQCQFMNDRNEIQEGLNLLKPILSGILSKMDNADEKLNDLYVKQTFFSCLSVAKDSVPMWNTYGQLGNGVALGFQPHIPSSDDYQVLKVIYRDTQGESKWIRKTTELAKSSNSLSKVKLFSSIVLLPIAIKNKAFEYEDEIRLVCDTDEVYFRSKNGMLVPYKKFTINSCYLREIIIGPANDADRMQYAIELLLSKLGLSDVVIKRSSVPLRN